MPQLGVAMFVVIVLNGVFAFAQEYRAEHAAERLRDLLPRRATVVAIGVTTRLASISALTQATTRHETPLARDLGRVSE